ncbi:MAG: EthD domain-containing protein [Acidimicrobiia bacterium]|nr:EthD domain-containing protein [Acidimicrobiia bacterium]
MIKLIALVKRNPELSREEFHRHWREHHGPLIRNSEAANRYVVRYEQNHRLADDYDRDGTGIGDRGFDGASFDGGGGAVVPLGRRLLGDGRRPRIPGGSRPR